MLQSGRIPETTHAVLTLSLTVAISSDLLRLVRLEDIFDNYRKSEWPRTLIGSSYKCIKCIYKYVIWNRLKVQGFEIFRRLPNQLTNQNPDRNHRRNDGG